MRKMMNKKGFSLVELMIVVVIMGILIAVAIPLYGAIQDNAKNNTCESNIDVIKQNAANYYAINDKLATPDDIAKMFDDGKLPVCPWDDKAYTVTVNDGTDANKVKGSANVFHAADSTGCGNYGLAPKAS